MVVCATAVVVAATKRLAIHTTFMPRSHSRNRTDRIGSGHEKSNQINEMEVQGRYRLWFGSGPDTSGCAPGCETGKGRWPAPFRAEAASFRPRSTCRIRPG